MTSQKGKRKKRNKPSDNNDYLPDYAEKYDLTDRSEAEAFMEEFAARDLKKLKAEPVDESLQHKFRKEWLPETDFLCLRYDSIPTI